MIRNLVKFYPSVMEELEKDISLSGDDYDTYKYIYNMMLKDKYIITLDDLSELNKLGDFDLDKHIYCYLHTMSENVELVKFDMGYLDYLEELISETRTKGSNKFNVLQVRRLIGKRQGNHIKKIYFRRIEYLLGMQLDRFIDSVVVVGTRINVRAREERNEEIVYAIARRLSVKYGYGYAINFENKTITINKEVKLYWVKSNMYHKKDLLFELNGDINNMCKVIDKICCRELFKSV